MKTTKADAMPVAMEEENRIPHLTVAATARPRRSRNGDYEVPESLTVAYGLALLPVLVSGSPTVPHYFERNRCSQDTITASTVRTELGQQLSKGSLIFGPDSALYPSATERWNTRITPKATNRGQSNVHSVPGLFLHGSIGLSM